MDDDELRRSAALEQRHWWYAGRRALVRRLMRGVPAGRAVDVGPGPGGNAAVLRDLGWQVTGVELTEIGRPAVRRARPGRRPWRRDPAADRATQSVDLVMSTDVWEHVEDHEAVARGVVPGAAARRSAAGRGARRQGHVERSRRRAGPRPALRAAGAASTWSSRTGFVVHDIASWNVLLRPVAKLRRSKTAGPDDDASEMEHVAAPINAGLRAAIAVESLLPVGRLPGLSLVVRAYRP